jgi:NADH:ubiquinone oxidoreductase subunit 6 (subunit J)
MKNFREEIQRRRSGRRNKRSSSWIGVLAKILLLIFVIVMIRFFGNPGNNKISNQQNNGIQTTKGNN